MSEGRRTVTQEHTVEGVLLREEHRLNRRLHDADDGTAAIRKWTDREVLVYEAHWRYGELHGRLRAWDDEGTPIYDMLLESGALLEKTP